jgi:hypothetical protein
MSGEPLYLSAEEGRDRITADAERVRIEKRESPDTVEEVIISRATLLYWRTTKRTVKPERVAEDAGRVLVFGEQHLD